MIILIAEAKTMETVERDFTFDEFASHRPVGESVADEVMAHIASMEVSEIAKIVKISYDMAAGLKQMAYEFPNKQRGLRSIEAYTGVVFKHFNYCSLTDYAQERCEDSVRIVSSLYGYLLPEDIIKPYRLEYTTPLGAEDKPMYATLREAVTTQLLTELKEKGDTEVLDLLPADAAKCIDWKRIREVATVVKVDFKDTAGEKIRSPHAGKLKAFRGELLRNILEAGLNNLGEVAHFRNDDMMPIEECTPGVIGFYV